MYSALFEVPSLGGAPRKVLFDVDSAPAFSPDGKRVCFRRGLIEENADSLVVAVLETGEERQLVRVEDPTRFRDKPAWSADGTTIAAALQTLSGGARAWITSAAASSSPRRRRGPASSPTSGRSAPTAAT